MIGIDTFLLGKSLKLVARPGDFGRQELEILAPKGKLQKWCNLCLRKHVWYRYPTVPGGNLEGHFPGQTTWVLP